MNSVHEKIEAALDDLEAEHLEVAALLTDVVDELRGAGWCEEHGYGDPVDAVRRLQVRATRAEGDAGHLRREVSRLRDALGRAIGALEGAYRAADSTCAATAQAAYGAREVLDRR